MHGILQQQKLKNFKVIPVEFAREIIDRDGGKPDLRESFTLLTIHHVCS